MSTFRKISITIIGLFLVVSLLSFAGQKLDVLFYALTPPKMPAAQKIENASFRNDQNWTETTSEAFHYKSQGSRTLNIPLSWFLALEEPVDNPLATLWKTKDKFSSADYLSRFGFIAQPVNAENPDGLPIGFATSPYQQLAGLDGAYTAVGFTCATCHTGQLVYKNQRYIIEGGAAMVDLGQLTRALGAALGQTAISAKLPIMDGRFKRFASDVLGAELNGQTIDKLRSDVGNVVGILATQPMGIDVTEGFSRLDALNRIGNTVFSTDTNRVENYVNINAPVNFPPIWTASWFAWVQYDGSIMSPLVRNMGEAMGTAAHIDFTAPIKGGRFSSTVPIKNLDWIESNLAGPEQPAIKKAFTGLQAPVWPDAFPAIDTGKAIAGKVLYDEMCQGCHLPALTKDLAKGADPDAKFWQHFEPIKWSDADKSYETSQSYLDINIIPLSEVGTDPGQSRVLADRTINTAETGADQALGLNTRVCTNTANGLAIVSINDDPVLPFPLGLGAAVQLGIDQWASDHFLTDNETVKLKGDQPNCLQSGQGYKARPLNGMWATAPFLHNGSVPSLEHLLGPAADRPDHLLLGDPTFDPVKVGIMTAEIPKTDKSYTQDGYFVLDTAIRGNSNRGHEFSNQNTPGVIGRGLDVTERAALIEFLKTL